MHTATDVARWILNYNNVQMEEAGADFISNLKLQKLLYYAQGCTLAFLDRCLFKDDIVAWEHGPVVEAVYHQYKVNEGRGIEKFGCVQEYYSPEEEAVLKTMYENFAQYSAWGLRNMTHRETPWRETLKNHIIPADKIKNYFLHHYVESN